MGLSNKPTFVLPPETGSYPFDHLVHRLVQLLLKRNFDVEGISIEKSRYGTGEAMFECVRRLTSTVATSEIRIEFGPEKVSLPPDRQHVTRLISTNALAIKLYPGEITVYMFTEQGLSGHLWQTSNFSDVFASSYIAYTRRYGTKPRTTHLLAQNTQFTIVDRRHIKDNPTSRGITHTYRWDDIATDIIDVLKRLIRYVEAYPERVPEEWKSPLGTVPDKLRNLLVLIPALEYERISRVKANPSDFYPADRYGLLPVMNLIPQYAPHQSEYHPAMLACVWGILGSSYTTLIPNSGIYLPSESPASDLRLVTIRPAYGNHMFVMDTAIATTIQTILRNIHGRPLTETEILHCLQMESDTIIPANQFRPEMLEVGCEPVVLFTREIELKEIHL